MEFIHLFKLLQKKLIFLFILVLAFPVTGFPQQKGDEVQLPTYTLKLFFPTAIRDIYVMSDTTTVVRKYSDSSLRKFKREYEFYLTEVSQSPPDQGVYKISVSTDSLFYKFTEGNATFDFNSQADNPGALNFEDLKKVIVPLGKDFTMTYSPYGEVVSTEGERLDWLRNYVLEQGKGILDTVRTFLWLDGISLNHLKFLCDAKKIVYPLEPPMKDSIWYSPIDFQLNSLNFYDTVGVKITDVNEGNITMEAKLNNIRAFPEPGIFYGIKDMLLPIESCKGTGTFKLIISPKGTLKYSEINADVDITVRVHNDIFTEHIQSKLVWNLLEQLTFK